MYIAFRSCNSPNVWCAVDEVARPFRGTAERTIACRVESVRRRRARMGVHDRWPRVHALVARRDLA